MNKSLSVYCDGGSRGNPGLAACAFVVYNSSGEIIYEKGIPLGVATNNHAEYSAVLNALDWLRGSSWSDSDVTFYLDSLLVVNQMLGLYKIKDLNLKQLQSQISRLISENHLKITKYVHIPRSKNSRADFMVNLTLDNT